MKKLSIFFLSLTCLAAQAQYNQNRRAAKVSPLLSYYGPQKMEVLAPNSSLLTLPLNPQGSTLETKPAYTMYTNDNSGSVSPAQQGYWSGTRMSSSTLNGRFQAVQTFDIQGNLRESKATYQFKRKKD